MYIYTVSHVVIYMYIYIYIYIYIDICISPEKRKKFFPLLQFPGTVLVTVESDRCLQNKNLH